VGEGSGVVRMCGQTLDDDGWVLLKLSVKGREEKGKSGKVLITVHCEDFLLGTNLVDLAKKTLA